MKRSFKCSNVFDQTLIMSLSIKSFLTNTMNFVKFFLVNISNFYLVLSVNIMNFHEFF